VAEVAGLAAGLFSTCVDCFKLLQVYRSRQDDLDASQAILDDQQFQLMAWGRACAFMDAATHNEKFDDPMDAVRNERIE